MNPAYRFAGADGLYPSQVDQLVVDGRFHLREQFAFDVRQPFTPVSWRGRMRTCNGVGSGALSDEGVLEFDRRLAALCADPERWANEFENGDVWHRVWGVIVTEDEVRVR
jgi:hypothetical protein